MISFFSPEKNQSLLNDQQRHCLCLWLHLSQFVYGLNKLTMSFLITDSLSILDKLEMNFSLQFASSKCWIIFSSLLNSLLLLAGLEEALALLTKDFEELDDEDERNL